jgi:ABC-type Fe2+-enterobactin transport system substrate-binding protein
MFACFDPSHESALVNAIQGQSTDAVLLANATQALNRCLADIVGQLRKTSDSSVRRELRSLYEGLTIALELVAKSGRPD